MASLGNKPWLQCVWLEKSLWPARIDLARKVGAAVGVSDGWGDGFGMTRLPEDSKEQMLRDIASLVKGRMQFSIFRVTSKTKSPPKT